MRALLAVGVQVVDIHPRSTQNAYLYTVLTKFLPYGSNQNESCIGARDAIKVPESSGSSNLWAAPSRQLCCVEKKNQTHEETIYGFSDK